MLVEKEVIRPGTYWYRDQDSGEPRKLVVTPELTRYWHEQGNAMLAANLTVPVPCEHDFDAHPMTPADKLLNNAGWVKDYQIKEVDDGKGGKIKDVLFGSVDVTDAEVAKKLPHTIRWTSPWINSFTDGAGKEWKNVISHLALTTRPRIVNQQPFGSIAAALSMATEVRPTDTNSTGFHLSRAGLLLGDGQPAYPMAFSMWSGGTPLAVQHKGKGQGGGQFTSSGPVDMGAGHGDSGKRSIKYGTVGKAKPIGRIKAFFQKLEKKIDHLIMVVTGGDTRKNVDLAIDDLKTALSLASEIEDNEDIPLTTDDVDAAFAWSPEARAKAAESRKRNAATRKAGGAVEKKTRGSRSKAAMEAKKVAHDHSSVAHAHTVDLGVKPGAEFERHHLEANQAHSAGSKAFAASKDGRHDYASHHHHQAAYNHVQVAKQLHEAGNHQEAHRHAEAANHHFQAAERHFMAHTGKSKKEYDASLAFGPVPPQKAKKGEPDIEPDDPDGSDDLDDDGVDDDFEDDDADLDDSAPPPASDDNVDLPPFDSATGDVSMVELLCDLLGALGITVEAGADEETFKRQLYNAAMTEIHNLTGKAKAGEEQQRTNPPGQPPNNPKPKPGQQPNPLVQQEQQPMFMSLDEIKKLDEPLRTVALSMHAETQRATAKATAAEAILNSLRDKTLKEENEKRTKRVSLLGRLSPRVKADLDAMLALPGMALSMGDGGAVVDPMASTLAVLEKGLADIPRLLVADAAALTMQPHPQDADMLTDARADEIADGMARQMGCGPAQKAG